MWCPGSSGGDTAAEASAGPLNINVNINIKCYQMHITLAYEQKIKLLYTA